MKKIIAVSICLIIGFGKNVDAQNDSEGAAAAALFGLAAAAVAVEQHKENLETQATNYIIANYPEYTEFRLKVIGWGSGGKKWSDDGSVSFIPFCLESMSSGELVGEKQLLVCFASSGWSNEFGLDVTKLKWELWSANQWNDIVLKYASLSSPASISSAIFKGYEKVKTSYSLDEEDTSTYDFALKQPTKSSSSKSNSRSNSTSTSKSTYHLYKMSSNDADIAKVELTADGLKYDRDLVVPFYNLGGDDYLIYDYNDSYKLVTNENSMGIYLKETEDFVLMSRNIINKVHETINE